MLSVVIPVYNEEESLKPLYEEIDAVCSKEGYELDLIFVDDGSTDGSWEIIRELTEKDPRVRGLRFRTNFGKAAGLDAGFARAKGELVMTLDADLQDDPAEIPQFLAQMEEEGLDVVSGWKKTRHDPWHKVYPSRVFNWMVSTLTGVKLHDHNCGMKSYRREIFDEVTLYGELHRFVPVLAAAKGYRVGERVVTHRARKFGQSKYGLSRFVKGFLDLLTVKFLTGFGQRPQHMLGTAGLISFFLGGLWLGYMAMRWTLSRVLMAAGMIEVDMLYHLKDHPAVMYATGLLLLGGQLISVGFLGELLIANHRHEMKNYSISEEADGEGEERSA